VTASSTRRRIAEQKAGCLTQAGGAREAPQHPGRRAAVASRDRRERHVRAPALRARPAKLHRSTYLAPTRAPAAGTTRCPRGAPPSRPAGGTRGRAGRPAPRATRRPTYRPDAGRPRAPSCARCARRGRYERAARRVVGRRGLPVRPGVRRAGAGRIDDAPRAGVAVDDHDVPRRGRLPSVGEQVGPDVRCPPRAPERTQSHSGAPVHSASIARARRARTRHDAQPGRRSSNSVLESAHVGHASGCEVRASAPAAPPGGTRPSARACAQIGRLTARQPRRRPAVQVRLRRRDTSPATPTSPAPRSTTVLGSGTTSSSAVIRVWNDKSAARRVNGAPAPAAKYAPPPA